MLSAAAVHNAHVQTDTENVTAYDASNPSFLREWLLLLGPPAHHVSLLFFSPQVSVAASAHGSTGREL